MPADVISLERFRAERSQRDQNAENSGAGVLRLPVWNRPDRVLNDRQLEHRRAMLEYGRQLRRHAHGRCLLVRSVLSGQKSGSEAIAEQKIARALYYQLEDRALKGMVQALSPAKSAWASERRELCRAQARIREQSGRLALLTQRKRSLERLLAMVMKTSRVSLDTRRRGRPPKALSRGMMRGADSP